MIQVVNFHAYKSAAALTAAFADRWLYVGRANGYYKLAASPLANPFVNSPRGRGQVVDNPIACYRAWLWQRMKAGDKRVMVELGRIGEDSVLVCWCAPAACHADIIKAAAEWLLCGGKNKPPQAQEGATHDGLVSATVGSGRQNDNWEGL